MYLYLSYCVISDGCGCVLLLRFNALVKVILLDLGWLYGRHVPISLVTDSSTTFTSVCQTLGLHTGACQHRLLSPLQHGSYSPKNRIKHRSFPCWYFIIHLGLLRLPPTQAPSRLLAPPPAWVPAGAHQTVCVGQLDCNSCLCRLLANAKSGWFRFCCFAPLYPRIRLTAWRSDESCPDWCAAGCGAGLCC